MLPFCLTTFLLLLGFEVKGILTCIHTHNVPPSELKSAEYSVYCVRNPSSVPQFGIRKVCWLTTQLDDPKGLYISSTNVYSSSLLNDVPIAIKKYPDDFQVPKEKGYFILTTSTLNTNDDSLIVKIHATSRKQFWFCKISPPDKHTYPIGEYPKEFKVQRGDIVAINFSRTKMSIYDTINFGRQFDHQSALEIVRRATNKARPVKAIYVTFGDLHVKPGLKEGNENMNKSLNHYLCFQRWHCQLFNQLAPTLVSKAASIFIKEFLHFLPPQSPFHYYDFQAISRNQRYGVKFTSTELIISDNLCISDDKQVKEKVAEKVTVEVGKKAKNSVEAETRKTLVPRIARIHLNIYSSTVEFSIEGGVPIAVYVARNYKRFRLKALASFKVQPEDRIIIHSSGAGHESRFIAASMCESLECVAQSLYENGVCVFRVAAPPKVENFLNSSSLLDYIKEKEILPVAKVARSSIEELDRLMDKLNLKNESREERSITPSKLQFPRNTNKTATEQLTHYGELKKTTPTLEQSDNATIRQTGNSLNTVWNK